MPVVLHGANVIPGRATRFLARFADTIAVAFEEGSNKPFTSPHGINRHACYGKQESDEQLSGLHGIFTLLITGVMELRLNQIASDAICKLHANGVKIQAIHLTTKNTKGRYPQIQSSRATVFVSGFSGIWIKFTESDFAVCRAGSSTCAELAGHAVPALLCPTLTPPTIIRRQTPRL